MSARIVSGLLKGRRGRFSGLWRTLLAVIIGTAGLFVVSPSGQADLRAALIVHDLVGGGNESLLRAFTERPHVTDVEIPYEGGMLQGRLYSPAGPGPHSGLVFVPGYPADIAEPLLNRFADGMARLGVTVLLPALPGLRAGLLVHDDVTRLVVAFKWLAAQKTIEPGKVGYGGYCVGSSLAFVAATDPQVSAQVAVVQVLGGYYDLIDFTRAAVAQSVVIDGREQEWRSADTTLILLVQNILARVEDRNERARIDEYLLDDPVKGPVPEEFSAFGYLAVSLLRETDPRRIDELLSALPPSVRAELLTLSPSAVVRRLRAPVLILHDPSDPYVPPTEAARLAAAFSDPRQRIYKELSLLNHVRPTGTLPPLDKTWQMLQLSDYLGDVLETLSE